VRGLGRKRGGLVRDRRRQRRRERGRGDVRRGRRYRLRRRCGGLGRRRHGCRRRHGLGLAGRIRNRHGVRHVVNDDRVVDVGVDQVVGRRCHVGWWTDPDRNRPVDWHRQHEKSHGRRWRCEHHELRRRWRKQNDGQWRRRRERKDRIVKHENRSPDIVDFFRRGRGQVIGHGRERRWRLEGGGKKG